MTLTEAIDARRSRRKYLADPIEPALRDQLEALAREYGEKANTRMEFVWDDGGAFNGLRKSYGLLTGVRNYAGLIAAKDDPAAAERLGYYGELLMLHAVTMGLGTCWVAGSFDRAACPFALSEGEKLWCTITVGPVRERNSPRENLIYGITHRRTKAIEDMLDIPGMMGAAQTVPDWFMDGMRAVQKAPSGVNRQPVKFSYKDGVVKACVEGKDWLDLGIAKLHFELGAGRGTWEWGNGGVFTY